MISNMFQDISKKTSPKRSVAHFLVCPAETNSNTPFATRLGVVGSSICHQQHPGTGGLKNSSASYFFRRMSKWPMISDDIRISGLYMYATAHCHRAYTGWVWGVAKFSFQQSAQALYLSGVQRSGLAKRWFGGACPPVLTPRLLWYS